MAIKDWKRWALFLIWLAVLIISLRAHTPWRDEYQSWLVSTRTPDLATFFDAVRYERHPPMHYLLQRSLVSVFPSVLEWPAQLAIETVTVPFTIGAALLLIFALGLPLAQSALLIFSPYLLREFGVISRSYPIGLFFLLAACAFALRKRFSPAYAMLALGSLTHLLFTWVCGSVFLLLTLTDRRRIKDPNFWLAGLIIIGAGLLQRPPPDSSFTHELKLEPDILISAIRYLNQSLWGLEKIWKPYEWNTMPLAHDAWLLLLLPALWLIHRRVSLWRFFLVCLPPLLIVAAGASMNTRTLGVVFFGFVACYVLFPKQIVSPKNLSPLTAFAFIGIFSTALWWLSWAPFEAKPKYSLSGTRELVNAAGSDLREGIFLVEEDSIFFPWMAETAKSVFDVRRGKEISYPHFVRSEYVNPSASAWCSENLAEFKKTAGERQIFLGLRKAQPFPEECGKHERTFVSNEKIITDETFEVYRLLK